MADLQLTVKLKKLLTCSICNEIMLDSRRTVCGHWFCSNCIEGYIKDSCPSCGHRISSHTLEKDLMIDSICHILKSYVQSASGEREVDLFSELICSFSVNLRSLKQLFSCPICDRTLSDCRRTTCGHWFCSSCIEAVIEQKPKNVRSIECPYESCRHKINKRSLKKDPQLMGPVVDHIDQMIQAFVDFGRNTNMKKDLLNGLEDEEEYEEDGEEEEEEEEEEGEEEEESSDEDEDEEEGTLGPASGRTSAPSGSSSNHDSTRLRNLPDYSFNITRKSLRSSAYSDLSVRPNPEQRDQDESDWSTGPVDQEDDWASPLKPEQAAISWDLPSEDSDLEKSVSIPSNGEREEEAEEEPTAGPSFLAPPAVRTSATPDQERVNGHIDTPPSSKGGQGKLKDAKRQLFTPPKKHNSESDYHDYELD